jgi:cytidine deaminase
MREGNKKKLINSALEAKRFAYTPITKVGVGAAVLTTDGNIYQGCNIQSVISGLGCCAERCAIHNAVAHGAYNFEAIAVAFPSKKATRPCGACLQIIHEFSEVSEKNIKIIVLNENGKIMEETTIKKLLPKGYGPKESKKDIRRYKKNKDVKK